MLQPSFLVFYQGGGGLNRERGLSHNLTAKGGGGVRVNVEGDLIERGVYHTI